MPTDPTDPTDPATAADVHPDTAAGYWPGAWPGEDGGPRRLQAGEHRPWTGFGLDRGDALAATTRVVPGATMAIQRDPGELYVQGAVLPMMAGPEGSTGWVERIDPVTLEPVDRSVDLPAGPWWPGGLAAHANGSLYLTQGRWCHRLDADCTVRTSCELPRDRPYNSLVVLPDGRLAMKDMAGDGDEPSELVVLDPDDLSIAGRLPLPEGSIARLSALGSTVVVVGMQSVLLVDAGGAAPTLESSLPYRSVDGQTYGWDAVLTDTDAWFLDNGAGTEAFGPSFRGKTSSSAPLHLVRVPLDGGPPTLTEVCGEPGGIVANPPALDPGRGIVVGYDSGHGTMRAWDVATGEQRWQRAQDHAGHMLRSPVTGEVLTYDFDHEAGVDHCVVLDVETGEERARVATEAPIQSVLFPSPGWDRDAYALTMATVTRVAVA